MKLWLWYIAIPVFALNPEAVKTSSNRDCFDEGILCENCHSMVRCIKTGDGTWTKTERQSCKPEKCVNKKCTADPEPICDGIADVGFPCQAAGIFPHPFYCNKFVLCPSEKSSKAVVNTCEIGYGYDIATARCDKKLPTSFCKDNEYPVPLCENLLQSGPLSGDETIYYTCEKVNSKKGLYPVLRKCPHGQKYDADKLCH